MFNTDPLKRYVIEPLRRATVSKIVPIGSISSSIITIPNPSEVLFKKLYFYHKDLKFTK